MFVFLAATALTLATSATPTLSSLPTLRVEVLVVADPYVSGVAVLTSSLDAGVQESGAALIGSVGESDMTSTDVANIRAAFATHAPAIAALLPGSDAGARVIGHLAADHATVGVFASSTFATKRFEHPDEVGLRGFVEERLRALVPPPSAHPIGLSAMLGVALADETRTVRGGGQTFRSDFGGNAAYAEAGWTGDAWEVSIGGTLRDHRAYVTTVNAFQNHYRVIGGTWVNATASAGHRFAIAPRLILTPELRADQEVRNVRDARDVSYGKLGAVVPYRRRSAGAGARLEARTSRETIASVLAIVEPYDKLVEMPAGTDGRYRGGTVVRGEARFTWRRARWTVVSCADASFADERFSGAARLPGYSDVRIREQTLEARISTGYTF